MHKWLQLSQYPDYEISHVGQIRRLTDSNCARRGRVLKPKVDRYGYLCVTLFRDGIAHYLTIHRLVALCWLGGPPSPGHEVAHFDGNTQNNCSTNLRWATSSENSLDKNRMGRMPLGEAHHKAKLTDADVTLMRDVAAFSATWPFPFQRQKDLGAAFGVSQSYARLVVAKQYRYRPTSDYHARS